MLLSFCCLKSRNHFTYGNLFDLCSMLLRQQDSMDSQIRGTLTSGTSLLQSQDSVGGGQSSGDECASLVDDMKDCDEDVADAKSKIRFFFLCFFVVVVVFSFFFSFFLLFCFCLFVCLFFFCLFFFFCFYPIIFLSISTAYVSCLFE